MGRTGAARSQRVIVSLAVPDVLAIAVARGSFVPVAASEPGAEVASPSTTTSTTTTAPAVSEPIDPPAAPTPVGGFRIERVIAGARQAPLGTLYRPRDLHEGVAIHGSSSNPGYAASDPCARVSNPATDMVWSTALAPIGTAVRVYQ